MKVLVFLFLICVAGYGFSQNNVNVVINVTNAEVGGGMVYLAIFANAEEFRKEEPFLAFELGDSNSVLSREISLPAGEYVISAFQDANGNRALDYNRLGIPRELVAISNFDGRGFPSKNFNRQKVRIDATTGTLAIRLHRF